MSSFFHDPSAGSRTLDLEKNDHRQGVQYGPETSPDALPDEDFLHDDDDLDVEDEGEGHEGSAPSDTANSNGKSSQHRSLSNISLFSANTSSIDSFYHPRHIRSPPQWWLKLKQFLYPHQPSTFDEIIPNYRYTPIFSGILIPFSILLEIPGLTQNWYIRTVNNHTVEKIRNPAILDTGLAISMACALAANIALITRFLERNVRLMTILCIGFLTLHDIINIIAVTTFGVQHRFDDGFTYGQSFWVTLCSTIASTCTNASLIVDFIRTPDFASSGSGLTRKQRSLIIIVIILLVYIAFGALIESVMLGLSFIDALYFTVCSIESIGFGDILPTTSGSKVFVCFYSIIGIINLALAVSLTRETVLEALEVGYRKRVHAVRLRRKNLRWEKRVAHRWREAVEWRLRERGKPIWILDNDQRRSFRDDGLWGFVVGSSKYWGLKMIDSTFPSWTWTTKWRGLGAVTHPKGMHLNLEALEKSALLSAAMEAGVPLNELLPPEFSNRWAELHSPTQRDHSPPSSSLPRVSISGSQDNSFNNNSTTTPSSLINQLHNAQNDYDRKDVPLTHVRLGKMIALLGGFALTSSSSSNYKTASPGSALASSRSNDYDAATPSGKTTKSLSQQYEDYRTAMEREETKAFYARLFVVWILFIVFWISGSAVFMATEGWSFGIALYFCVIAFSTIGYGDYSPKTPAGRSVFVGWALLGVATMTILISVLAEVYTSRYKTAVQSTKIFDRAVNKYKAREKAKILAKSKSKTVSRSFASPTTRIPNGPTTSPEVIPPFSSAVPSDKHLHTKGAFAHVSHALHEVDKKLEDLPRRILGHARLFHEHLQYFVGPSIEPGTGPSEADRVPPGVKQLMDDIAGASEFGERIQQEILQDKEARQTLFTLSIEKALRKMIEAAEEAIESLEERDRLLAMTGDGTSSTNGNQTEHEPARGIHHYQQSRNDRPVPAAPPEAALSDIKPSPPTPRKSELRFLTDRVEEKPR